jgi:hypothetical protein
MVRLNALDGPSDAPLDAFKRRVFSGEDVLQLLEAQGLNPQAVLHLAETAERIQHNGFQPDWTFSKDLTTEDVREALAHLLGAQRPRKVS